MHGGKYRASAEDMNIEEEEAENGMKQQRPTCKDTTDGGQGKWRTLYSGGWEEVRETRQQQVARVAAEVP